MVGSSPTSSANARTCPCIKMFKKATLLWGGRLFFTPVAQTQREARLLPMYLRSLVAQVLQPNESDIDTRYPIQWSIDDTGFH
jgi:hypothetical protein